MPSSCSWPRVGAQRITQLGSRAARTSTRGRGHWSAYELPQQMRRNAAITDPVPSQHLRRA